MTSNIRSIRAFIGAKEFEISCSFYKDFGFEETVVSESMSYFRWDDFGFYLQKAYVKEWVDNTMLFLEVQDLPEFYRHFRIKKLENKYPKVRVSEIHEKDWGDEFFVHDPSGVLWHIGVFKK